jgi:Ca2+-binding RTX toxin-like protein
MRAAVVSGTLFAAIAGQAQAAATLGETFVPPNTCSPGLFLQTEAPGDQYTVPSARIMTAWSFQASGSPPSLKLKVARPAGGDSFTIIGESGLKTPTPNVLNTYTDVQIPVQAGDVIGTWVATNGECGRSTAPTYGYHYFPADAAPGNPIFFDGFPTTLDPGFQLDISARLEPDCDSDGLGDETQDTDTAACTPPPPPPITANCAGRVATLVGTDGNETLVGTPDADVIAALGGKDIVQGLAGDDRICGGEAKDTLKGGGGNDRLKGGASSDTLKGGGGNDKCVGGPGGDAAHKCEVERSA